MSNKLELTWIGKETPIRIEPRILIENAALSNCANDAKAGVKTDVRRLIRFYDFLNGVKEKTPKPECPEIGTQGGRSLHKRHSCNVLTM